MNATLRDLRHAVVTLKARPGLTAIVILTLARGVGANTAIFSVVYGVLLRPLGFTDEDRLMLVEAVRLGDSGSDRTTISLPDYWSWRSESRAFEELAFYGWFPTTLEEPGQVQELRSIFVSANLPDARH